MINTGDEALGWLFVLGLGLLLVTNETSSDWQIKLGWMIVLGFVLVVVISVLKSEAVRKWLQRRRERKRNRVLGLDKVDKMTGAEFERYIGDLLEARGFRVEHKGGSADFGADLIAARDGHRYVVQAKRRGPGRKVPPRIVRATIGAREHFGCNRAMVVTNQYFSDNATKQAGTICQLIDRGHLADWIRKAQEES